ncbi:MAG: sulfatase-like hydrolase/transferase [Bryobacterales bacterium]|nr:sulfatase-like hydrolase/transferase [Bryobacterales bacterium]
MKYPPLLALLAFPALSVQLRGAAAPPRPQHAVLLIIDGLSYRAPERIDLPNLQKLIAAGTYYRRSHNIMPAHPRTGEWAKYHRSSIPNPVILAGTVMLRPDQQFVQHCFFPARITAHSANDMDYQRLNVGFNLSFLSGSDDDPVHDDQTMYWALEFLRRARPAFMKVHLQDTGGAGMASYSSKDSSQPFHRNIWAPDSPYRQAAARADSYLGQFLAELDRLNLRDKTVFFVTSDHGQADAGWHPYDDPEGWSMPLVLAGPGIRPGQKLDYAEQIDIVPTLCHLMGVKPPPNVGGRILAEALTAPPAGVPAPQQHLRELNELLREAGQQAGELRKKSPSSPVLKSFDRDFYGLDRILEWSRFGVLDKLIAHNRQVLSKLSTAAGR